MGAELYFLIPVSNIQYGGIPTRTYFYLRILKHFELKICLIFWSKYLNPFSIKKYT